MNNSKKRRGRPSASNSACAGKRLALGLTQDEFASALGVSASAIHSIECGRLPLSARMEARIAALTGESLLNVFEKRMASYRQELMNQMGITDVMLADGASSNG